VIAKQILSAFSLSLTLALSAHAGAAVDWNQWRGPNRDGISTESIENVKWPQEGPKVAWKAQIGAGYSTMAVANGKVYAMGNKEGQDTVYCFDALKGTEVWKQSYAAPKEAGGFEGPRSTPCVDGKVVYTLGLDGQLRAFDAEKGTPVWAKDLKKEIGAKPPQWGFSSSPLVEGKVVIVEAGGGASVAALDKTTGAVAWKGPAVGGTYASAVPFNFGGKRLVGTFNVEGFIALDAATGAEAAKFPFKAQYDVNASDPVIIDDKVFVSNGYNTGHCAMLQFGAPPKQLWENKEFQTHFNCVVAYKGCLYGTSGHIKENGSLKCVDAATGAVKWTQPKMHCSIMLAGDKIIALERGGMLYIVEADPSGYKEVAKGQVLGGQCWTMPVFSNGHIYARNNGAGDLVCLDVSGK